MSHLLKTTALIGLIATPTLADVNARNVWDVFTANYRAFGLQIEATENYASGTLKLSDIKISGQFPLDWGSITITTTGLSLIENGDGTVAVQFPENMPLAVALSLPDELFITATMDQTLKGYKMIASGDPDKVQLDYSADLIELKLNEVNSPVDKHVTAAALLSLSEISGVTTLQTGEMLTISQDYEVAKTIVNWDYSIEGKTASENHAEVMKIDGNNELVLPNAGFDFAKIADQFRSGASIKTAYTSGSYTAKANNSINGAPLIKQDLSVDSTDTFMSLAENGFAMKMSADEYFVDMQAKDMPFPLRGKIGQFSGDFQFPVLQKDVDQDIVYSFAMNDFTMDSEIWALFDPNEILPRDPANFTLNLSGKAKLFVDLLDFETMDKVMGGGTKFGEISSVSINELVFSAVDTELNGTGAFSFNNDDLQTFDGMPAPDGGALLKLSGLDALIDKLTKMGVIAEGDVMGMRMGLMMFTKAGDQADTLISDIKITPDGKITANGKRIK